MSSSLLSYNDNLPSEKAPAPEKPFVILHIGLQCTHFFVFSIGQYLSSTLFPWSINSTCLYFFSCISS